MSAALAETAPAPAAVTETPAPAPVEMTEAARPEVEDQSKPEVSALDADLKEVYERMNRPAAERDENGRFKSDKPVEADPEPPAPELTDQSPEKSATEPATPAIDAPVSWSREMKQEFAKLPPAAQEYIARRESEATQQISRLGQKVQQFEPVAQIIEQHADTFRRNGLKAAEGVSALLRAQDMLDTNPRAAIAEIARAYNVDLGTYDGQPASALPSREVLALQAELAALKGQLNETRSQVLTREERDAQTRRQALEAQVVEFTKDKPDIDVIEADMVSLIPSIRARNPGMSEKDILTQAYEQASWMNPTVRAKRIADEKAKADAEAAKKAEAAKNAAALNVRTSQNARPGKASMDDDLHAIWRKNHG